MSLFQKIVDIINSEHFYEMEYISSAVSFNLVDIVMRLQVLEPSLAKGNRVMVFCNTLNSSRAVDHYLSENQISAVNYHGEVPAEQRYKFTDSYLAST